MSVDVAVVRTSQSGIEEDDTLWRKTTFDERRHLTEDGIWRKTTFDRIRPLTEDDLLRKTTFDGRRHLREDNIWRKTTFDRRRPLTEDDLWQKTTFDRVYSILPEKYVYDSSPWRPQHNWSHTGNPISSLSRKKNFTWWKKCTRHYACAGVQKRRHF